VADTAGVTAPRQVVPGRTLFITRRCTQRQFLLLPEKKVVDAVEYCLAEAALRTGVTLHAWRQMTNHFHMLIRDNEGRYPEFLAHFHKLVAKVLNAHWGRSENFWSNAQPSVVWAVTRDDAFDKLVYLLANPVAADLVERATEWPATGSLEQNTSAEPLGKVLTRPDYFRKTGPMPEKVVLTAERIGGFEELTSDEWAAKVRKAVREAEVTARDLRRRERRTVLGVRAVMRAKHTDTPKSPARRTTLFPHIACRDVALCKEQLAALAAFRYAHRNALRRLCAGEKGVVFPPGTYRVRLFGVRCADSKPRRVS